mmetsp:Transcript_103536/g.297434  ORF Transcript_103536/g.297434 Transcript_103536/m.297434 type:complete len:241 (-) Transcript_103536:86-808(-)
MLGARREDPSPAATRRVAPLLPWASRDLVGKMDTAGHGVECQDWSQGVGQRVCPEGSCETGTLDRTIPRALLRASTVGDLHFGLHSTSPRGSGRPRPDALIGPYEEVAKFAAPAPASDARQLRSPGNATAAARRLCRNGAAGGVKKGQLRSLPSSPVSAGPLVASGSSTLSLALSSMTSTRGSAAERLLEGAEDSKAPGARVPKGAPDHWRWKQLRSQSLGTAYSKRGGRNFPTWEWDAL